MPIEAKMEDVIKKIFNNFAPHIIQHQKNKLKLIEPISKEDYFKIAKEIQILTIEMAGNMIGNKIYKSLIEVIDSEKW